MTSDQKPKELHSTNRGAFARHALDAHAAGLQVIPTRANNAKVPLVQRFHKWRKQNRATIETWVEKFGDANMAYLPGPSGLVVIDADSKNAAEQIEDLFGGTPFQVRSGGGQGRHFLYRAPANMHVKSIDLRAIGISGELKAEKTIVVAPGSVHPVTGHPYEWCGPYSFADLKHAPVLDLARAERIVQQPLAIKFGPSVRLNHKGQRNNRLFDALRSQHVLTPFNSEDQVIECAENYDLRYNRPPLSKSETPNEVVDTARGVWRSIQESRFRKPAGNRIVGVSDREIGLLETLGRGYGDAHLLLNLLRRMHWRREQDCEPFAIACDAMANEEVIAGWTNPKRFRRARQHLMSLGFIEQVRWSCWQKKQPALYILKTPNYENQRCQSAKS